MAIISPSMVQEAKSRKIAWPFGALSEIVYARTYSRPIYADDGSYKGHETWPETLARCINALQDLGVGYTKEQAKRFFEMMLDFKCLLAGRMLWQLGTSTVSRFGANSLINCYFVRMDQIDSFLFLFNNLMLGGGVGIGIQKEYVHELPRVKRGVEVTHQPTKDADFIVPDSREGWVELLNRVLQSYLITGKSFTYSTILVRGKGEPIRGFGGVASGPQVLVDGIEKICRVLKSREGCKLRSVDVLDIACIVGSIVVSANVRRSAILALGDPDDIRFLKAKRWDTGQIPAWRAMANNSISVETIGDVLPQFWDNYRGNAEPYGLVNIRLLRKVGRSGDKMRDHGVEGVNPCVPADTWVMTSQGPRQVASLTSPFDVIVDGKNYRACGFFVTGYKDVYCVRTKSGHSFKATADHLVKLANGQWAPVMDLRLGDQMVLCTHTGLSWNGPGTYADGMLRAQEFDTKDKHARLDENVSSEYCRGLVVGFARRFSSQNVFLLSQSPQAIESMQRILLRLGIMSYADVDEEGILLPDENGYFSVTVDSSILDALKGELWNRIPCMACTTAFASRTWICKDWVYDVSVPDINCFDGNGFMLHNCGEIGLENRGVCCLGELVLNRFANKAELFEAATYIYMALKTIINMPFIDPITTKVAHSNNRIGIGVTGICAAMDRLEWLSELYEYLRDIDEEWSAKRNWPRCIKITTVKPSGTLSLLAGTTPGVHPAYSRFMIRRVRFSADDPLVESLRQARYPVEYIQQIDGSVDRHSVVVSFPVKSPERAVTADQLNAIDLLNLVATLQELWSDNAVSCTVYYRANELDGVKRWLAENFDNRIKSVSFLPYQDHGFAQAPLSPISEEEYHALVSSVSPLEINYHELRLQHGTTDTEECTRGCPIR